MSDSIKISPDCFFTSKILEKFHDALNANDDIVFFDEDFSRGTSFANCVDLDKINLDDDNDFDIGDPETIIQIRFLAWCHKFEKHKIELENRTNFY